MNELASMREVRPSIMAQMPKFDSRLSSVEEGGETAAGSNEDCQRSITVSDHFK
jgi:hypothetical protein